MLYPFPFLRLANANHTSPAHTSGPWFADAVDLVIDDEAKTTIAVVHPQMEPTDDSDITSANARLIAAAPDQYEALQSMIAAIIEMIDADDLEIPSDLCDLLLQIASIGGMAIAKAEGR